MTISGIFLIKKVIRSSKKSLIKDLYTEEDNELYFVYP